MNNKNYYAHPLSVVDEFASIGEGSKIWHFSHISNGARIGKNCILGQNTYVGNRVVIGDGVKIQNNVSIYEGVIIEDFVFIGPSVVFTNINTPRSEINRHGEYRMTIVKRGASIGANSTIICGVTIGTYALIGAGAVVTKDVSPFSLIYGNPAREHGRVCRCGMVWKDYCKPCPDCGRKIDDMENQHE